MKAITSLFSTEYQETDNKRAIKVDFKSKNNPLFIQREFYTPSFAVSVISLGVVPICLYFLSKIIPRLIYPGITVSVSKKKELNKIKDNFINNPENISRSFFLQSYDGAQIDGLAIFNEESDRNDFDKKKAQKQKWIIWFHGKFYEEHLDFAKTYAKEIGANILVFNYRNVSESKGILTLPQDMYVDGHTCIEYLQEMGVQEKNMFFHGLSMGGAVATKVATLYKNISGSINEKSYSSLNAVVSATIHNIVVPLLRYSNWQMDVQKSWLEIFEKNPQKHLIIFHRKDRVVPYPSSLYKGIKTEVKPLNHKFEKLQYIKLTSIGSLNFHEYNLSEDPEWPKVVKFVKNCLFTSCSKS